MPGAAGGAFSPVSIERRVAGTVASAFTGAVRGECSARQGPGRSAQVMSVRVRFAPSPTGMLHVGGARTALFNWLFARRHGGVFVLRIEDTDIARERPGFREEIFRALAWLGITHDEGPDIGGPHAPYTQRERLDRYRDALATLQAGGFVYPCFCRGRAETPPETTDDEPEDPATHEHCACGALTPESVAQRTRELGTTPAQRFRVDRSVAQRVEDLIRGEVVFPPGEVEDFIIVKAGGDPLYNFCAVVDDAAMRITHVIRGEEHLANTPKQILMYRALGKPVPQFAHLPILLNAERKKLSKRDGATAVSDYRRLGYLPEALRNFLALLGWSPGGDRELLTLDELLTAFDLGRVQKHGAVYDTVKLTWMNGEYLKTAPIEQLVEATHALLVADPEGARLRSDAEHLAAVWGLMRERVKTVVDLVETARYFFTREATLAWDREAVAKRAGTVQAREHLRAVGAALEALDAGAWTHEAIEAAIRALAERAGVKAGEYIQPLRVALTGQAVSAGIFETAAVLGRELVLARVAAFLRVHDVVEA